MTSTMQRPARNGSTPSSPAGLRAAGRKRRRPSWVAAGVLIVFGAGLVFAWWASSLSDRIDVLATAHEVPAGAVIDASDLRVVQVAAHSGLATMSAGEREQVVGHKAAITMPAGALVQPADLAHGSTVPTGKAVVGVSLRPGALPTVDLRVGDRVLVVQASQQDSMELADAIVYAIGPDRSSAAATVVSLLVSKVHAVDVARAAGLDQVRLVLLDGQAP